MHDLYQIGAKCMNELARLHIPYQHPTRFAWDHAKRRWGCCHSNTVCGVRKHWITITDRLKNDDVPEEVIHKIMLHELLHTCDGCQNHGATWKRYADIVHKELGYDITRTDSARSLQVDNIIPAPTYKYILRCKKCGATWKRMRSSDFVRRHALYRCACGGEITLL